MDKLFLSQKVLSQQICTECLNYLSVGPVMVSGGEKVICGRCRPSKQPELKLLNHSLYNLVAENLLFKCINFYEGCEELLNFNVAIEHEKNCKAEGFKCPFCEYEGNGCQLVQHFDQKHPGYVVKEDTFKIIVKETFSRNLIFVKKNCIFHLTFSTRDTSIEFTNLQISPAHLGPKHYKIRFFKSDTNIEFVTSPIQVAHESGSIQTKNSFLLDQSLLLECFPSGWCFCKIELVDICDCDKEEILLKLNNLDKIKRKIDTNLRTDIVERRVIKNRNVGNVDINRVLEMPRSDLREFVQNELRLYQYCDNCKEPITAVIYFCPKYHMACKACLNEKCTKCDIFCLWNTRSIANISLPCDWSGCRVSPNIFTYMVHKRDCTMRRYKCPDAGCEFEGCIVDLKKHWHINPIFDCNELELSSKSQSLFWYARDCHEMFYVSTELNGEKRYIAIYQVDVVLSTSYNFKAGTGCFGSYTTKCPEDGNNFVKFDVSNPRSGISITLSCSLKYAKVEPTFSFFVGPQKKKRSEISGLSESLERLTAR